MSLHLKQSLPIPAMELDIEIEPEDAQDGRAHSQAGTQPQIQQNADSTAVPVQATTSVNSNTSNINKARPTSTPGQPYEEEVRP